MSTYLANIAKNPTFNKNFFNLLYDIKKTGSYNFNDHLNFYIISLANTCFGFNALMSYYIEHPEEQLQIDKDFSNLFTENKGKFFAINISTDKNPNTNIIYDEKNQKYHKVIDISLKESNLSPSNLDIHISQSKETLNILANSFNHHNYNYYMVLNFNEQFCFNSKGIHSLFNFDFSKYEKETYSFLEKNISAFKFFEKFKEISLTTHTNKLRDLIISYCHNETFEKSLAVQSITPYSILQNKHIISNILSCIYSPNNQADFIKKIDYLDSNLLNQLIITLHDLSTSYGFFKDLDGFNFSFLNDLQDTFNIRYNDIKEENRAKLRILLNIAKDKGIELNYSDERASVGSVTDKKMLIFGDKVNCEVIIIDLQTLTSRFSTSFSTHDFSNFVNLFFKFTKEKKIFDKISINEGKRSYYNILTIFCVKGKLHSEEKLQDMSDYFEEAVLMASKAGKSSEFSTFLEQAERTINLTNQLDEKAINHSSKNKI